MEQRSLMVITAHPDDEAFGTAGTVRRLTANGGRAALVCATHGEAGEISDPALATPETLAEVREGELRRAAQLMGICDITILGYPDGGVDGVDEQEAVGRLVRELRRFRPEVILTFEANGGYGHRDHMAIHRLALKAFERAGDPAAYPDTGLAPFAPGRLLGMSFPRSIMQSLRESAPPGDEDSRPGGDAATIPLEQMGTPDELIAYDIALSPEDLDRKLDVLRSHATQIVANDPMVMGPPAAIRAWLGRERFTQIAPPADPPAHAMDDVFAGIAP